MDTIGECIGLDPPGPDRGEDPRGRHGAVLGVCAVHAGAWGPAVIRFSVMVALLKASEWGLDWRLSGTWNCSSPV
jgi:hypothetical protein